jgi:uncharacterized metal-binding protein
MMRHRQPPLTTIVEVLVALVILSVLASLMLLAFAFVLTVVAVNISSEIEWPARPRVSCRDRYHLQYDVDFKQSFSN